jgi:hypothetical protein
MSESHYRTFDISARDMILGNRQKPEAFLSRDEEIFHEGKARLLSSITHINKSPSESISMAAILCQGIGQACSGLGEILCLPCKACGLGCRSLCDLLSSPFLPYTALTFCLNLPPIVLGFKAMQLTSCQSIEKWFLVNVVLCIVHCVACLYIVHKIRYEPLFSEPPLVATPVTASVLSSLKSASVYNSKTNDSKIESGTYYATPVEATNVTPIKRASTSTSADTRGNSMGRIKHVLCHDVGVAIYIVLGIAWIIWQSMGIGRLVTFDSGSCGGGAVADILVTSLVCGYLYMSLVGIGFVCSLCCLRS